MTIARSVSSMIRRALVALAATCSLALALSGCQPAESPVQEAHARDAAVPDAPSVAFDAGSDGAIADPGVADAGAIADPEVADAGPRAIELTPARADVLWLLDTSGSWVRRADRYRGVADALRATTSAWSSADHALGTFPRRSGDGESCVAADYEELELAFGATPDELLTVVESQVFEGGSPLGPALQGAITAAAAQRAPGTTVSVVILTDASPFTDETCASSEWPRVAEIAARGLAQGVHTHVLSVMSGGVAPEHPFWMSAIATEGDGFTATVNGSRSDVARSAATFLADVRDHMEVCSFEVPSGLVPERALLREGDGTLTELWRVPSRAACTHTGFYLDDPRSPSTLTLCSGYGGVGGLCQLTYVRARTAGAPVVEVVAE